VIRDRVIGWPVARLSQMAAVRASSRWAIRALTRARVRPAVLLQVELALEGVVDRLDERADRGQELLTGGEERDRRSPGAAARPRGGADSRLV